VTPAASRILVVEDDARVRRELVAIASAVDDVDEASSRAEAEDRVSARMYRLVLMDLLLPDGSGLDVLDTVVAAHPAPPVVVVSSTLNIVARNECLARGAADFISKPFHHAEILRRIQRVLERHPGAGSSIRTTGEWTIPDGVLRRISERDRTVLDALTSIPRATISLKDLSRRAGLGSGGTFRVRRIIRRLRTIIEEDPRNPRIIVEVPPGSGTDPAGVMFVPPRRR
jgi:two-component system, OmpR family, response regulator QseB